MAKTGPHRVGLGSEQGKAVAQSHQRPGGDEKPGGPGQHGGQIAQGHTDDARHEGRPGPFALHPCPGDEHAEAGHAHFCGDGQTQQYVAREYARGGEFGHAQGDEGNGHVHGQDEDEHQRAEQGAAVSVGLRRPLQAGFQTAGEQQEHLHHEDEGDGHQGQDVQPVGDQALQPGTAREGGPQLPALLR